MDAEWYWKSRRVSARLSNSGDILKFLRPSYIRRIISGWGNDSCKVISQKIYESIIDYRGSKSVINLIAVKEQRVDGSWQEKRRNVPQPGLFKPQKRCFSCLRCTLTNLEINLLNRIHSKHINNFLFRYSSTKASFDLNSSFIAGFVDGEGCFSVTFVKDKSYKLGWQVKPKFSIGLHTKDRALLEKIQNYLGIGGISTQGTNGVQFYINSIKDRKILVEFLNENPLISQKRVDFTIYRDIVQLMENREHLTLAGLQKIVALKANLNTEFLPEALKVAFPDLSVEKRPYNFDQKVSNPSWLAGFTSADGSFMVRILNSPDRVLNAKVQLEFNLTQHMRDEQLMKNIAKYLDCGGIYLNKNASVYRVLKLSDIIEKIIPLFQKYPIRGVKSQDFSDFVKVAELMKENKHLTPGGLKKIKEIKVGMNSGRSELEN